jgi:hypothetical protein
MGLAMSSSGDCGCSDCEGSPGSSKFFVDGVLRGRLGPVLDDPYGSKRLARL